ncbi:MAG: hypothetical protein WDN10_00640 [bacterium]
MNAFISSLYTGYALYAVFPYLPTVLSWGGTPEIKLALTLGVYALAVAVAFPVLKRFMGASFSRSFAPLAILGLLALGFIIAMLYHVFGATAVVNLPPLLDTLFAPKGLFFYWFIAPLVGLFFLSR